MGSWSKRATSVLGALIIVGAGLVVVQYVLNDQAARATLAATDFVHTSAFEWRRRGIVVPAEVDGRGPYPFLLDTGASVVFDQAFAAEVGIAPNLLPLLATTPAGHTWVRLATAASFRVAGLAYTEVGVTLASLPSTARHCDGLRGLAGAPLFMRAGVLRIDFAARRISISDDIAKAGSVERAARLDLMAGPEGNPHVPIEINGTRVVALIDTGNANLPLLPAATYRSLGGVLGPATPRFRGASDLNVAGQAEVRVAIGRLTEVRLGDIVLRDVPVLVSDDFTGPNLGSVFLERFDLTIDWSGRHVYFERNATPLAWDTATSGWGISTGWVDGHTVIAALLEGGAAERAGIRAGDVLVRINEDDYRDAGLAGFCRVQGGMPELYGQGPIGVVVDGGGTLKRVTLPYVEPYGG